MDLNSRSAAITKILLLPTYLLQTQYIRTPHLFHQKEVKRDRMRFGGLIFRPELHVFVYLKREKRNGLYSRLVPKEGRV